MESIVVNLTKIFIPILILLAVLSWIAFGISMSILGYEVIASDFVKNLEVFRNVALIMAICTSAGSILLIKYG